MKIGELVDEGNMGDQLILDKTLNYLNIEKYISLWEGRIFGMVFMVEIFNKMNAKSTIWHNHKWEVQLRSMQILFHMMYKYVKCVLVPTKKISTFSNGGKCGDLEINIKEQMATIPPLNAT
jgi:hypothetical protein